MAQQQAAMKPELKKPPGYRDPNQPGRPVAGPPPRKKPVPPPALLRQHEPPSSHSSFCRIFCCFLCFFFLILMVVLAMAGGVFYLLFNPKLPVFYLRSCQIPRFDETVSPSGTYIDTHTVTGLEVKNPNSGLDIFYSEGIEVLVNIGDDKNDVGFGLGPKEVRGFTQKPRNLTSFKVVAAGKAVKVDDAVGKKLQAQYLSKEIKVGVEAKTRIGYIVKGWRIGTMQIDVLCGRVRLKRLDAGDMPRCTINAFRWINIR